MTLSVVQLVVIVCAVLFLFIWYDSFKRQKINWLHLIVFTLWVVWVLTLLAFPSYQIHLAKLTWVARWADVIIYTSIICGVFGYFQLINTNTKTHFQLTKLISESAIKEWSNKNKLPIKNNTKPWILIRAYNEEGRISWVIEDLIYHWYNTIIIVNDWSKDSTSEKIEDLKHKFRDIDIIDLHHTINRWWGSWNKTLFSFIAKYWKKIWITRRATIDADWQMDVKDIDKFFNYTKESDFDIIFWTRFTEWARVDNFPVIRKIILRWGRLLIKVMYGTWVTDPHNGMRLFSTSALEKIHIDSDSFNYANEIIEQVCIHRLKYIELPTHIIYTDETLAKGQQNSNAIKMLIEMIYKKFFYR